MENKNQELAKINTSEIRFEPTLKIRSVKDLVQLQLSEDKLNSIAVLRKQGGLSMDVVFVKIQKTVLDIMDFYGESYNNAVFDMIIEEMAKIGYMLNGADFDIFASNAISGKYKNRVDEIEGKDFAIKFFKLTPDTLIDWFKIYIFDRGEEFAKQNQIKPKQAITDNEIKLIQIFADAVPKDQEKPKETTITEQQKVKEKVQTIWSEFKALQIEQDSRLVEVNGKHYDYNEFLKLRTT